MSDFLTLPPEILDIPSFLGLPENWKELKARQEAEQRACKGLTDPEKQIKALVEAARGIVDYLAKSRINDPALDDALEPFKNYGEKIK